MARERITINSNQNNEDLTLIVREIYKNYGKFCAVRNLTFGIRKKECFGLLGIIF